MAFPLRSVLRNWLPQEGVTENRRTVRHWLFFAFFAALAIRMVMITAMTVTTTA